MKIAFTPAVYEHAARFVDRTPWDVSRDAELMFEGHRRAWLEYRHEVIVVGIDIYNLETEAYGARIHDPGGDGIPSIHQPLLASAEEGAALPPFDPQRDGRLAMVIDVARRLKDALPEAQVRVPVAGPFSIAFNLRGISNLCEDTILEPEAAGRMLTNLAENQAVFCRAIARAGLDGAFFESAAAPPILSPRQFRDVELPALRRVLAVAAEATGSSVPCIMGGDTYPIVDDLLSTGTRYLVCNVETDQAAFVNRVLESHPGVRVRVNLDPAVVVSPDPERLYPAVDRVLAIAQGSSQCVMGTGALPFETPLENVRFIREYLNA